jgi:hypothetical protein
LGPGQHRARYRARWHLAGAGLERGRSDKQAAVRCQHVHRQAACFRRYLGKLRVELDGREDADSGCIKNRFTGSVDRNSDVDSALQSSGENELVIVDLHSWVDERGPWHGVIRRPSVWLQDLAPKSWAPRPSS